MCQIWHIGQVKVKQECIGIPDMILLLMIFLVQKKRLKQK